MFRGIGQIGYRITNKFGFILACPRGKVKCISQFHHFLQLDTNSTIIIVRKDEIQNIPNIFCALAQYFTHFFAKPVPFWTDHPLLVVDFSGVLEYHVFIGIGCNSGNFADFINTYFYEIRKIPGLFPKPTIFSSKRRNPR